MDRNHEREEEMPKLGELSRFVKTGTDRLKEISENKKVNKTDDLKYLSKSMANEVIAQYNQFTSDKITSFNSKYQEAVTFLDSMKDHSEKIKEKTKTYTDEQIKEINIKIDELKKVKEDVLKNTNSNKEAVMANLNGFENMLGVKVDKGIKDVRDIIEEANIKFKDIKLFAQSIEIKAKQYEDSINNLVDQVKLDIVGEYKKHKNQVLDDLMTHVVMNFGKILLTWIKSLFGKK